MNTIIAILFLLIKKCVDADYSDLIEEIETNLKAPKFKLDDRVVITKYKNIFSLHQNFTPKNCQKKYFLLILC